MTQKIEQSSSATMISRAFPGLAIDKRRLPQSKLTSRGVPAYIGEWLIDQVIPGTGLITQEEQHRLTSWVDRFVPKSNDQNIIRNRLLQGEAVKLLTPLQVEVHYTKKGELERSAILPNLDLKGLSVSSEIVEKYPELLRQGMWGVVELLHVEGGIVILSFNPMQATVDLSLFKSARAAFSFNEWRSLMLTSMGYSPKFFDEHQKTLLLCRLLPLVQKSMHQVELAPKATGKSYLYENISPHIRLESSGNITPAVLFVNNQNGRWGLLARYKTVVLDEVQTLNFGSSDEIVGGLKGFLANAQLTRGGLHQTASDSSLVMLANIKLDQQQNPMFQEFLLEELPSFFHETAFMDRLKGIVPGWELPKLGPDAYANSMGLKADYFGDILIALRDDLSFDQFIERKIKWNGDGEYSRNTNSVRAAAAGLLKLQFPDCKVSDAELELYCLRPAMNMRQLVWDQLRQLDPEFRQYSPKLSYEIMD